MSHTKLTKYEEYKTENSAVFPPLLGVIQKKTPVCAMVVQDNRKDTVCPEVLKLFPPKKTLNF